MSRYISRNDFAPNLSGTGVEIGVDRGLFSEYLLENSRLSCLYSIDPWSPDYPGFSDMAGALSAYAETALRLHRFGKRSVLVRAAAESVVDAFNPESLDFVYIDSAHTYEDTRLQLNLWYPKVKSGSLFAGHDYVNGPQVKQAVDEFVAERGLSLETTVDDKILPEFCVNSWFFFKPEI